MKYKRAAVCGFSGQRCRPNLSLSPSLMLLLIQWIDSIFYVISGCVVLWFRAKSIRGRTPTKERLLHNIDRFAAQSGQAPQINRFGLEELSLLYANDFKLVLHDGSCIFLMAGYDEIQIMRFYNSWRCLPLKNFHEACSVKCERRFLIVEIGKEKQHWVRCIL